MAARPVFLLLNDCASVSLSARWGRMKVSTSHSVIMGSSYSETPLLTPVTTHAGTELEVVTQSWDPTSQIFKCFNSKQMILKLQQLEKRTLSKCLLLFPSVGKASQKYPPSLSDELPNGVLIDVCCDNGCYLRQTLKPRPGFFFFCIFPSPRWRALQ